MESRTDKLSARLLRCPVGCAFLLTIERDQVPVALAVTPPQAFARATMALRTFDPWSRDFAQAVPAALSRSGGSSGRPLVDPGVSLPEGDSGHRSALRSPLPWRERVRVRGTPEVTPGVPVRSPRAQASDAAAHRRSRISGPCSHATPAIVFRRSSPALAGRAAARRPLPPPSLPQGARGPDCPRGGRAGGPSGGVGAKPPTYKKIRGWVGGPEPRSVLVRDGGVGGLRPPQETRARPRRLVAPRASDPLTPALSREGRGSRTALGTGVSQRSPEREGTGDGGAPTP